MIDAINDTRDTEFVSNLETKLKGFASVVEQSDGLGVLRLGGPALSETLAKGVQIDLAPAESAVLEAAAGLLDSADEATSEPSFIEGLRAEPRGPVA